MGGLAKNDFAMLVRRELVLGGHGMLVPGADIEYIAWHGEAARASGMIWAVVPFECRAGKAGAIDFFRDFVVILESPGKMIQVGITYVLNDKVVDNESKHDRATLVKPEAGGGGCLVVLEFGKAVLRRLLARMPAWGRPYMPRRILK